MNPCDGIKGLVLSRACVGAGLFSLMDVSSLNLAGAFVLRAPAFFCLLCHGAFHLFPNLP